MNIEGIEHHLQFFTTDGQQVEHYGCMDAAFVAPRVGERVRITSRDIVLDVNRVEHEYAEYSGLRIGHVVKVYGDRAQ